MRLTDIVLRGLPQPERGAKIYADDQLDVRWSREPGQVAKSPSGKFVKDCRAFAASAGSTRGAERPARYG